MKFWNKQKEVRRRCWVKVHRIPGRISNQELKVWCQQQSSTGKFYYYYGADSWWFENKEDAVMFVLKWGAR